MPLGPRIWPFHARLPPAKVGVPSLPKQFVCALNHVERVFRHHPRRYIFAEGTPNDEKAMLEHYMQHCGLPRRLHDQLQQVRVWRNRSMHPPDWSEEGGRHWRAPDDGDPDEVRTPSSGGSASGSPLPPGSPRAGRRRSGRTAARSWTSRPTLAEAEALLASISEKLELLGVQYSSPLAHERRYPPSG